MAKYTTEVRSICESLNAQSSSSGYNSVSTILSNVHSQIFSFNYPIFDNSYKSALEIKILRHYYTREIAAETYGLWKLWLEARMNEIMPYYNKLYQSELLQFNPLYDVDITRDHSGTASGSREDSATTTGSRNIDRTYAHDETDRNTHGGTDNTTFNGTGGDYYSDTPQGGLDGVADLSYLTTARQTQDHNTNNRTLNLSDNRTIDRDIDEDVDETNSASSSSSGEYEDVDSYLEHVRGKNGGASYSKMLEDYRKTFLNIDMMIINELSDLFFNLW